MREIPRQMIWGTWLATPTCSSLLSHPPPDQSNRPTSSLFSHNDEEREAEASQQDCEYLLYKNFKNEYATQIHATVRGWRNGQVFTHHRRLDQYDGGRDSRGSCKMSAEGVEEIK